MIPSKRILLPISLLFVSAPLWKAEQLTLFGRGLFIRNDAFVSLGLSLLFASFVQKWLPEKTVRQTVIASEAKQSPVLGLLRRFAPRNDVSILFLAFTFISLIAIDTFVLHSFLSSGDEHSCYFLAECLRLKKLWIPTPPLSEFFNVVHVGNRDGKWFSVYPPGWPLIWAAGLSLKIGDYLNPLMATLALAFFFLAAKKVFGEGAGRIGIVLVSPTPFFMFNSASYFSHPTCLLMVSLFLFAYVKYVEAGSERERSGWAVLAALAVGYGLMTRYLTMAAVSAPFLLTEAWQRFQSKKWRKSDTLFLLVLGVFIGLILYQNWAVTGKPFKAPNKYDKSWERLGFRSDYTPLDGLIHILSRFFYLMDWFPPILLFLFFGALFLKHQSNLLERLFRWGFFYPVIAYFFYYSWGGSQYGPRYYYEGFLFLGVVLGDAIVRWWKTGNGPLRKWVMGALLASFFSNGYLFYKQSEFFEAVSSERKSLYDLAERTIENKAIVFIRGHLGKRLILTHEDAVRNHPLLNTKILYAHDLGDRNKELMALYPERESYLGSYDSGARRPILTPARAARHNAI